MSDKPLYHIREEQLSPGSIITPGRWGSTVSGYGESHQFYKREQLLEAWRIEKTGIAVSRMNCTFAFESEADANEYLQKDDFLLRVKPLDRLAPSARLDMLWLTWMGESNATLDQIQFWCASYWSGKCCSDLKQGARLTWEHLWSCPLVVV